MASADHIGIELEGKGGHAARPHLSIDTILVGAQIINALQSIVARNVDPLEAAVVSICMFQAGHTDNVIPQHAKLRGTARALTKEVGALLQQRIDAVVEGTARLYGATAKITYTNGYPVLVNHDRQTEFAASVAREIAGKDKVDIDMAPVMGAEDFSFLLRERPGAFIFVGNGDSAGLHHPAYDFNDETIPVGTSYWVRLAETALAG
jgi:hippurate hydrolase